MMTSPRTLGLLVFTLALESLATVGPVWGLSDAQSPDPNRPNPPVVLLRDELFKNPNGALFACAHEDGYCVGLLLSNQDGVSSQAQFIEGKPQGAVGTHAYLRLVDAPAVICACPGGPDDDPDACARACLAGFRTGEAHESQRASCEDCGRLTLDLRARKDVAVDDDGDPDTPPVIKPLAYLLVGQAGLVDAVDSSGDACSATLVLDETVPPFDFSFTFENHNHGTVTHDCL